MSNEENEENEETVKIRVGMSVNYAIGTTREDEIDTGYTRAEWNAMSEKDRDAEMQGHVDTHVANHLDAWWNEVE